MKLNIGKTIVATGVAAARLYCLAISVFVCILCLAPHPARAQEISVNKKDYPIRLAIREVEGQLFVLGEMYSVFWPDELITASFRVDFEENNALIVSDGNYYRFLIPDHAKTMRGDTQYVKVVLQSGKQMGRAGGGLSNDLEFKIPINDVRIDVSTERGQRGAYLQRYHQKRFDDHPLDPVLGRGFWKRFRVVLDLPNEQILLYPLKSEKSTDLPPQPEIVRPFEIVENRIQLRVNYGEGKYGRMIFTVDDYDTLIDREVALGLGKPAGDIGSVWIGERDIEKGIDLSRDLALRPRAALESGHLNYDKINKSFCKDGFPKSYAGNKIAKDFPCAEMDEVKTNFMSGINLLETYVIDFDWENAKMGFTRAKNPQYPQADFNYFKAEASGSAAQMQAYLEANPQGRRAFEAAQTLAYWRMEEKDVTDEQLIEAVQWVADAALPEHRMDFCMDIALQIGDLGNHPAAMARAGEIGLQHSRMAMYAEHAYHLHNLVGEAFMKLGEVEKAWRHFISAAFMPLAEPQPNSLDFARDISVNINLGNAYLKMGQINRAYSRFKKAQEQLKAIDRYGKLKPFDHPPVTPALRRNDPFHVLMWEVATRHYNAQEECRVQLERLAPQVPEKFRAMIDAG